MRRASPVPSGHTPELSGRSTTETTDRVADPAGSSSVLVSIITPTLNQASFLEATLASVMAQSHPRIQHIVVDGGSSDNTVEILRRYEGRYDLSWTSEPDGGMYAAVNRGFAMAEGDVLAYLNSDDLYLPWTVATAVGFLRDNRTHGLVYGDGLIIDERKRTTRLLFYPPFHQAFVMRGGFLMQPTLFWRRDVHAVLGGFDESLRYVADLDFTIRAGRTFRVGKVNELLAVERRHPAAKTSAELPAVLREAAQVRSRYESRGSVPIALSRAAEEGYGWLYRRRCWAQFALRSRGRVADGGPWGHFLAAGRPRLDKRRVLLAQVPPLGRRMTVNAVILEPGWIESLAWASDGGPDEPV
jgi:GT2 family glycosyltransferase